MTYSIRDLEELSGIPAHTIRTWERRYGLFTPTRVGCNVRCYNAQDIAYLHHLVILLKQGHRISTLACKTRSEVCSLANESAFTAEDGHVVEKLCFALREFNSQKVENLMNCYIRKEGFDHAILNRFIPFLDQVSFLMLSGLLQRVHTQIFHQILRQKIHAAIDGIALPREGLKWILIHHEEITDTIYRDIMHYLLRKRGCQVLVAGTVKKEEVHLLDKEVGPDGYCLVTAGERPGSWLHEMLAVIPSNSLQQGRTLVLVPGKTLEFLNNTRMDGVTVLNGLQEAFVELTGV